MASPSLIELGGPIPLNHGNVGDLLHDIRELRLTMQKELDALEARERELKDFLIGVFDAVKYPGAIGQRYKAMLESKTIATVKDWPAFHKFVRDYDRFDMMQKRANDKVIMEAAEAARMRVPGTEDMIIKSISLTKR